MTRETIGGNICFTYIPSEKFKTGFFSAQMALPLTAEAAGRNALLVNVLSRGTARCPDIEALGRRAGPAPGPGPHTHNSTSKKTHFFCFLFF